MGFSQVLFWLFTLCFSNIQANCNVKDQKTLTNTPCSFPFIFDNKIHFGCTTELVIGKNILACSTKTSAYEHIEGHWGECDPQKCPNDALFTQGDNQIALKTKELIDQYKASDVNNEKLDSSLNFGKGKTNDCPCVKATECKRMLTLLTNAKKLSRAHPERQEIINYIRSQICDAKNQAVRCCGTQIVDNKEIKPTPPNPPSGTSNKEIGTWKPLASKKECGTPLVDVTIVGGYETLFGSYPFMALLGYTEKNRCTKQNVPYTFQCGATVINKYYILTAAHCFRNSDPSLVALGEHDLEQKRNGATDNKGEAAPVIIRGVEKIIRHEKYSDSLQGGAGPYDIALIRVNESIPLFDKTNIKKSNVIPICLPWNRNDPGRELNSGKDEFLLKVLGWGQTTNDPGKRCSNFRRLRAGAGILQQLDVPFISWRDCKKKAKLPQGWEFDIETQICAGGIEGEDSCNGDSGGPLITRSAKDPWFQVGVVSFGASECGNGVPGFYTNVVPYLPWIEKNLEP